MEARWQARLAEVTELSLPCRGAAAAAPDTALRDGNGATAGRQKAM